jgi:hypothetical protein
MLQNYLFWTHRTNFIEFFMPFLIFFFVQVHPVDDLNGSVGSIADLKPKGLGFESRISQGFFLM